MHISDLLVPLARKNHEMWRKSGDEHPIITLQRDMNRIFNTFWRSFDSPPFETASSASEPGIPCCDMLETDKAIEVSVDLPGLEEKDIDVSLTDNALTIKGKRKTEREENKKGYSITERHYGSFSRTISLPSSIDKEMITATFKNGVLTITLPRTAEVQARIRKIPVATA